MSTWSRWVFIALYDACWWIATPLLPLVLLVRVLKGKDRPDRVLERLALGGGPRPRGKLIWLHGSSVGEARSVVLILKEIIAQDPSWHAILTTSTVTAYDCYKNILPAQARHVFVPLDHPLVIALFRFRWRPDAVVWSEQDLWPNMMNQLVKRVDGPRLYVQARFSGKSLKKWSRNTGLLCYLVSCFTTIYAQSNSMKDALIRLGITNCRNVGNLKRSRLDTGSQTGSSGFGQTQDYMPITGRRAWIALSLHPEDIKGLLDCHAVLRQQWPDAIGLWILRHPGTWQMAKDQAQQSGQRMLAWDDQQDVRAGDIVVWRRVGGLDAVFSQPADICVIGGSFDARIGGHNPFEPLAYRKFVLFGPHMDNFSDEAQQLCEQEASQQVEDYSLLAHAIAGLWSSEALMHKCLSAITSVKLDDSALETIVQDFFCFAGSDPKAGQPAKSERLS